MGNTNILSAILDPAGHFVDFNENGSFLNKLSNPQGQSTTTSQAIIPDELKPLINSTVARQIALQDAAWKQMMPGYDVNPDYNYGANDGGVNNGSGTNNGGANNGGGNNQSGGHPPGYLPPGVEEWPKYDPNKPYDGPGAEAGFNPYDRGTQYPRYDGGYNAPDISLWDGTKGTGGVPYASDAEPVQDPTSQTPRRATTENKPAKTDKSASTPEGQLKDLQNPDPNKPMFTPDPGIRYPGFEGEPTGKGGGNVPAPGDWGPTDSTGTTRRVGGRKDTNGETNWTNPNYVPPGAEGVNQAASGWVPSASWTPPEGGILGDASRNIVGPSGLEDWAASQVPGLAQPSRHYGSAEALLGKQPSGYYDRAQELLDQSLGQSIYHQDAADMLGGMEEAGKQRVTGAGLWDDPAVQEAMKVYDQAMRPMIESQASLAGLGRSNTLANATAAGQAQYMLPTIQDYMGREERSIDRNLANLGDVFTRRMGLGDREISQLQQGVEGYTGLGDREMADRQAAISGYMGLGDRDYSQRSDAIGQAMNIGGVGRQIAQGQADAPYNDWLRKAALFEQSIGGPMGLTPSTIGSSATSTQNKK